MWDTENIAYHNWTPILSQYDNNHNIIAHVTSSKTVLIHLHSETHEVFNLPQLFDNQVTIGNYLYDT